MKLFLSLTLILVTFISHAQDRGCSVPPHESKIFAKVYSSNGIEKPSEACVQFHSFHTYTTYITHNENEGSVDSSWVIHIAPGDQLIIESEFASDYVDCSSEDGYIYVSSGEISELISTPFSFSFGSCSVMGSRHIATIDNDVELIINSPTYSPTSIIVKTVEPPVDEISEVNQLPFISQIPNSNEVIITTNSELTEEINIYSISGNLIERFTIENSQIIQLADLPKGIYLLQADVNGELLTGKYVQF